MRAGLRALRERDDAVERWLKEEVVSAYDKMVADPSRGVPIEDVRAKLRARNLARFKDKQS